MTVNAMAMVLMAVTMGVIACYYSVGSPSHTAMANEIAGFFIIKRYA